MIYSEFVKKTRYFSYLKTEGLSFLSKNARTLKNQIGRWQKQGKIHLLKKGIYTLNDEERRAPLPTFLISNVLYTPSYISLESAMAYWDLIPEAVHLVTAVTYKKTAIFRNFYGAFSYRTLRRICFFGFVSVKMEGLPILMATAEKAILDKVYLDRSFKPHPDYFLDNLRLQNYEHLSQKRLLQVAKRFQSKKVSAGASILVELVKAEKR